MKVRVELTAAELAETGCDSVAEFEAGFFRQLNDGIIGDAGEVGEDWLPGFTVEIVLV